jgi:hypothetical protein
MVVRVRAKFAVTRLETTGYAGAGGGYGRRQWIEQVTIVMRPVYSDKAGTENKKFWDATPSGELRLGTVNAAAAAHFKPGREYYLDFTAADEVADAEAAARTD